MRELLESVEFSFQMSQHSWSPRWLLGSLPICCRENRSIELQHGVYERLVSACLIGSPQRAIALGRWDDGIRLTKVALALDPFDPSLHLLLGNFGVATGELEAAEGELRKMLRISPSWGEGHFDLGGVLLLEGKVQAALAEMQQEQTASSRYVGLAMVYHAMGRHADSDAALDAVRTGGAQDYASEIADAYRGDADAMFSWLERAYRQKDAGLYLIKTDVFLYAT